MKEKDTLFRNMYERKFYGGSYYDGIKVGKPEEYDLDYVLNLPVIIEPVLEAARDKAGFVHIRIMEYMKLLKRDEASKFEKLDTLMDTGNYLSTFKVLQWMERVITLAFNELEKVPDKGYRLDVKLSEEETLPIYATPSKAFPAFTLKLKNGDGTINLDIDLVPCFQFTDEKWPNKGDGYRPNPCPAKNKFLIVPKKPHGMEDSGTLERYWRLSFQEQERELIKGREFKSMKPTIKMLKKLRDKQNHVKIASYYIKTIFLWEVQSKPIEFWKQSGSLVLMTMLKRYAEMIQNKCIPYYWNAENNLIGHLKEATVTDIGNSLKNIIDDVERNLADPFVLARYLIGQNEIEIIRNDVDVGKKHKKNLIINQLLSMSPSPSQSSIDVVDFASSMSEEEKVKRLILNDEFLKEVAEHISKYLRPKLDGTEQLSDSGESRNPKNELLDKIDSKTDEIMDKISDLTETCHLLSDKVSKMESSFADLRAENGRLKLELSRACPANDNQLEDFLFDSRLGLTANLMQCAESGQTLEQEASYCDFGQKLVDVDLMTECPRPNCI